MIVENLESVPGKSVHELIELSRDEESATSTRRINRDYALGHHRTVTDATRRALLGNLKVGVVSENMIGRCIHELNGRIRFREFGVADATVKDFLALEFSAKNQMDRAVSALIPRVLADGNASMSVSWRRGRPMLHHEQWWDGENGMFVATSDTGDIFWAVSEWTDSDENHFRTVYQPHRIERFRRVDQGWESESVIDWTFKGAPIGVPVAHFPNGASPYGPYPESTVSKVIDVQDSLNANLFNRQVVSAYHGSPQFWATGVSNGSDLETGAGKLWTSPNEGSRFGSIPAGDMESLLREADDLREIIGGEFSVPTYRIGQGDWPSGVALVRADAPMIKRCQLLIDNIKPGLVYLAHKSVEIANVFSPLPLMDEDEMIEAEFYEPDEIDPGTRVEIDQAKVDLYSDVLSLPPILIEKLDLFTSKELAAIKAEIAKREQERQEQFDMAPPQGGESTGF